MLFHSKGYAKMSFTVCRTFFQSKVIPLFLPKRRHNYLRSRLAVLKVRKVKVEQGMRSFEALSFDQTLIR